jgi:hypothetical protein
MFAAFHLLNCKSDRNWNTLDMRIVFLTLHKTKQIAVSLILATRCLRFLKCMRQKIKTDTVYSCHSEWLLNFNGHFYVNFLSLCLSKYRAMKMYPLLN